ncbi:MAG: glycosyltransferase family 4 protein [Desulfobacteraceae bacterium]|nr:glycosyltransferase family 4 protein [Desulfobacteraceae bacterium]
MNYKVLCITDRSDLPETELFIGLKNAGVDISVICNPTGNHYDRLARSGITAYDLILNTRFSLSGIQYLKQHLQKHPYNILYCFNNKAASNVMIATRGMNFKIATYRGTVGNISFASPASLTTHLHPRVNRIVCVSNAVRDHIIQMNFFGKKIPPDQVVAIYKGHDISWYRQPPADLTEFKLPKNAFVVTFAGRNRPHKGIDYLIDSARYLPPDTPVYFLLLGRLEGDKKLRAKIDSSPFKKNIILAGFRKNAPAIFAASDAFIMPSTRREGLSRAVIEAMSSETVPIVTDAGGLPELVIDSECGFVVPPQNAKAIAAAIMRLFTDPDKKHQMAMAALDRIKNDFNIKTTVANTQKMFEGMLLND